jgi:hypothetical protein
MENMSFGGFSAGLRRPNHLTAIGGLLAFGRLAAIFAGPEFGRLLYLQHFAAKSQATPPTNLNALRPLVAV